MSKATIFDLWDIDVDYLTTVISENPSLRGMILGYVAEKKLHDLFVTHGRTENHKKDDDHIRTQKGDLTLTYKGEEFRIEVKSLQTNTIEIEMPDKSWAKLMKKITDGRKPSSGTKLDGSPKIGAPIYKWVPNEVVIELPEEHRMNARYRGKFQCDASDRRDVFLDSGEKVNTTLLKVGEFDIIAAGIFGFRGKWEFGFALNRDLPRSTHSAYSKEAQGQLIASLVDVSLPLNKPFESSPFDLLDRLVKERQQKKS